MSPNDDAGCGGSAGDNGNVEPDGSGDGDGDAAEEPASERDALKLVLVVDREQAQAIERYSGRDDLLAHPRARISSAAGIAT